MTWSAEYGYDGTGETEVKTFGIDTPEAKLSYEAARQAASAVLSTGALGGPVYNTKVSIVGHSNPGNKPVAGWANDFVTITVTQLESKV